MSNAQFNTIVQMIAELSAQVQALADNQKNFLTKEDAKNFLTKEDAKNFLTQEGAKAFATKEDLVEMTHTILSAVGAPFAKLEKMVERHEEILKHFRFPSSYLPLQEEA